MSDRSTSKMSSIRAQKGFSMALVLGMGLLASIWILAIAAWILPTFQKMGQTRAQTSARAGSEAALDWTVAQLNELANGRASAIPDDATADGMPSTPWNTGTAVPSDRLPPGATARVWINNISPPGGPNANYESYVYDPQLDPSVNKNIVTGNGWREVTATARFGSYTKSVRLILKPGYKSKYTFNFAAYVANSLVGSGNHSVIIDGYLGLPSAKVSGMSSLATSGISTTSTLNLGGSGSSIDGDVTYYGPAAAEGGAPHIISEGARIKGNFSTNDPNGIAQTGVPPANVDKTYTAAAGNSPPDLTVPTAPEGAKTLPSNFTNPVAPGDYIITDLSKTITPGPGGNVRVWVQNKLSIAGGSGDLTTFAAKKLQIYYSGNVPNPAIQISGNDKMCASIFAPNATMKLSGNGHFYGSAVMGNIEMKGGGNSGGFSYDTSLYNDPEFKKPQTVKLQAISWQELDR